MVRKDKKNVGFTIIELLIYMSIMSVFLVVIAEMFISISNLSLESSAISSVQQDGRYLIARLSYDIKRAQKSTSPTVSVAIPTPGNAGQTSDSLQLTIDNAVQQYSLNGSGNLIIKNMTTQEENQLNGSNTELTNLQFLRLGNPSGKNSITINFTLSGRTIVTGKGREERSFSTIVSTR
ncbi:MAG: prepilin-type N-terminal cleavage/methylation domain-containing protein [Candidatus Roizmanbacteria bacterium]